MGFRPRTLNTKKPFHSSDGHKVRSKLLSSGVLWSWPPVPAPTYSSRPQASKFSPSCPRSSVPGPRPQAPTQTPISQPPARRPRCTGNPGFVSISTCGQVLHGARPDPDEPEPRAVRRARHLHPRHRRHARPGDTASPAHFDLHFFRNYACFEHISICSREVGLGTLGTKF